MARRLLPELRSQTMRTRPESIGNAAPLEGRYANCFQVGYDAFEFLLDFGQLYSETEEARFHTRIILSPAYLQSFIELLNHSLERYQTAYPQPPAGSR